VQILLDQKSESFRPGELHESKRRDFIFPILTHFFPEVRTVRSSGSGEFCQHPSNETERIVARNRLFRCQREHRVSVETCCGQGNISSYHIEDRHVCPGDAHLARHNGKTGKVPLDAEDQGVARTYSSIGCGMLVSFLNRWKKN
jgi:hypothetical protein